MTLTKLVVQAVTALKTPGSRKGISRQADNKHAGDSHSAAKVNLALKHAVDAGKLKQSKGSFRLAGNAATAAVKAVKKASKAKKAVAAADAKPKKVAAKPKAVKATKATKTVHACHIIHRISPNPGIFQWHSHAPRKDRKSVAMICGYASCC
jgi:hypothetical protein